MTLRAADGTVVKKAAVTTYTDPLETVLVWNQDIYEDYEFPGVGAGHEKAHKLKYGVGDKVTQAKFDALYSDATATAISPATGPAAGDTDVEITGTNFRGTTGVTFDGVDATDVVVVSPTKITCTTPANSAGTSNVVIKAAAGDLTKTAFFTFT